MKVTVEVKLHFEATHNWPVAEGAIEFLKYPHRHIFHVIGRKVVSHMDREVEFFQLANRIRFAWRVAFEFDEGLGMWILNSTSCETIAHNLLVQAGLDYCAVYEDGENGAIVEND